MRVRSRTSRGLSAGMCGGLKILCALSIIRSRSEKDGKRTLNRSCNYCDSSCGATDSGIPHIFKLFLWEQSTRSASLF